jgi:hypothetical protein
VFATGNHPEQSEGLLGGFDCILGNPPFLGDKKLNQAFGSNYISFLRTSYQPNGVYDLVTYFFRKIFFILKSTGYFSLISTNTIAQGDSRESSLDEIVNQGGRIVYSNPNVKWPGQASVYITLVSIFKGKWEKKFFIGNKEVKGISTLLSEGEKFNIPFSLIRNAQQSYIGNYLSGMGFCLNTDEAIGLMQNPKNSEVIFPFLNGEDLNSIPTQISNRYVINFFDFPLKREIGDKQRMFISKNEKGIRYASDYADCLKIIEQRVKPEREKKNDQRAKEFWWQHARPRMELYSRIHGQSSNLVVARTSKTLAFSLVPKQVFSDSLVVFSINEFSFFAILQSTKHEVWAWKYCTTMKTDLVYTPTNTFETFPFPEKISANQKRVLDIVGEDHHEHRRQLMLSMQLGLTKTYNAFHAPEIQTGITTEALQGLDKKAIEKKYGKELWNLWNHLQRTEGTCSLEEVIAGIIKLRELHVQMDEAVLEAYGWGDVQLRHNFYEVDYLPENDRIRYTIHPDARKEVLKRLLELNHQYFEKEARQGLHKEETVRKFYEQKGTPMPEEVSKWFEKGKAYKKPKTKSPKANEPQLGYGGLFDQLNE